MNEGYSEQLSGIGLLGETEITKKTFVHPIIDFGAGLKEGKRK
jgi:hypothetical protein